MGFEAAPVTAAVYARVSTSEQAEKLLPIADQLAACRDLCQARGWPMGLERTEATLREVMRSGEVSDTRALARDYEATVRALAAARASLAHDREAARPMTPGAVRSRLQQAAARLLALGQSPEAELAARPVLAQYIEAVIVQPRRVTVQLARGLVETSKVLPTRYLRSFRFDMVREGAALVAA